MRLKGSYTVEASLIISFSLIIFGVAVSLSYGVFKESMEYVQREEENIEVVRLFRTKESVSDLFEKVEE